MLFLFALTPWLGLAPLKTVAYIALLIVSFIYTTIINELALRTGWMRLAPVIVPLNVLLVSLGLALLYATAPSTWVIYLVVPIFTALLCNSTWSYISGALSSLAYLCVVALTDNFGIYPAEHFAAAAIILAFTQFSVMLTNMVRRQQLIAETHLAERLAAETKLRESEEQFRRLTEHAQDLIHRYRLQPSPGFEYVSPSALRLTGFTPEEFYADPQLMFKCIHPDDLVHVRAIVQNNTVDRNPLIARWIRKDKRIVWFEQLNVPITDPNGKLIALEAVTRDVTETMRVEATLREQIAAQQTIAEIIQAINSKSSLAERLYLLVERCVAHLHADIGAVNLLDPELHTLNPFVQYGTRDPAFLRAAPLQVGQGLSGWIAQNVTPLAIPNVLADPRWVRSTASDAEGFASYLGAPLQIQGQVIGVLDIATRTPYEFLPSQIEFLTTLAGQAALAIHNARLLESAQTQANYLAQLNDITRAALAASGLPEMLQMLADRLGELFNADGSYITLWDEARQRTVPSAAYGHLRGTYPSVQIKPGQLTMTASVLRATHALAADDTYNTPYMSSEIAQMFTSRAILGLPLIAGDQKLGAALIGFDQPHHFTVAEIARGEQIAVQIALAIAKAKLNAQTEQRAAQLSTLNEIGHAVSTQSNVDSVLQVIYRQTQRVLPLDAFTVCLYDAKSQQISYPLVYDEGIRYDTAAQPLLSETPLAKTIQTGISQFINRTLDEITAIKPRNPFGNTDKISASLLFAPLRVSDRIIGALSVQSYQFDAYTREHLALFTGIADQVAIAIENARLFDTAHQHAAELEAVRQASLQLTAQLDLPTVLNDILASALRLTKEASNAHIFLYHDNRLTFGAALWQDGRRDKPWSQPREQGLTYTVARTGQLVVVPDMQAHPLYVNAPTRWDGAILGLPLKIGARVVGVMNVAYTQPHPIAETELRVIQLLADQAAIAIENARLFEATTRNAEHLAVLNTAAIRVQQLLNPQEIFRAACDELRRLASFASVLLLDDTGNLRHIHTSMSQAQLIDYEAVFGREHPIELSLPVTLISEWHALQAGETLISNILPQVLATLTSDSRAIAHWIAAQFDYQPVLLAPLTRANQTIGVMVLMGKLWDVSDVPTVALFARQVSAALENARLLESAQQSALEQATLSEIARALNATLNVRDAFPAIVSGIRTLTQAERISLALIDDTGEQFTMVALDQPRPELSQGTSMPLTATSAADDVLAGRVHLTPDLFAEYDFIGERALYDAGFRSRVNLPLVVGDHAIGALNLVSSALAKFTPAQFPLLLQIANAIAIAIENTRLFEAEQTRRAELATLYDLSRNLAAATNEESILTQVAASAVASIHTTFARVALIQDNQLVIRAAHPVRLLDCDMQIGYHAPLSRYPLCERVIETDQAAVVYQNDPGIANTASSELFLGIAQTLFLIPLRVDNRALGLLMLGERRHTQREPFSMEKIRLARNLSDQAASALRRTELFSELENAYLQTVLALANAVDAKDTETGNHSQRLAELALAVGKELNLDARTLEDLRYGAILHDIGKIGVPDAILLKPAALDANEWSKMRQHPTIGAQILAPLARLTGAATIVRHHHERYDGTGYPDQLAGEAIPIGARILTIVDAYGAIMDKRIYKEERSAADAAAELQRCAGAQFDPQIVHVFLRLIAQTERAPERAT